MNLDRLTELLAAYGADPARWPALERQAAHSLVEASSEAQRLLKLAAAEDTLLVTPPGIEPNADLTARILARLPPSAPSKSVLTTPAPRFELRRWLESLVPLTPITGRLMVPQLATLAFALFIGIAAGFSDFGVSFLDEPIGPLGEQLVADASLLTE